jgi:hypothetical protein
MLRAPAILGVALLTALATTSGGASADEAEWTRIAARLDGDAAAARIALRLFDRDGVVVDVEQAHRMDGGFRGAIAIVPALPAFAERDHLSWTDRAFADFDDFFGALAAPPVTLNYRYRPIVLRYFRSVGRTTPSAYASGWSVAYNVDGSLMTSADAVRETLFHEIFHLNDAAHADWSQRVLEPIFRGIVARCGAKTPCLAPYAPGSTMVRGGTYYAFYPGNGVVEYAAELALRYYREHRAVFRKERVQTPFKCARAENARAWRAMADEFFGGVDRTPPCEG